VTTLVLATQYLFIAKIGLDIEEAQISFLVQYGILLTGSNVTFRACSAFYPGYEHWASFCSSGLPNHVFFQCFASALFAASSVERFLDSRACRYFLGLFISAISASRNNSVNVFVRIDRFFLHFTLLIDTPVLVLVTMTFMHWPGRSFKEGKQALIVRYPNPPQVFPCQYPFSFSGRFLRKS
jgi:hypothetical protein